MTSRPTTSGRALIHHAIDPAIVTGISPRGILLPFLLSSPRPFPALLCGFFHPLILLPERALEAFGLCRGTGGEKKGQQDRRQNCGEGTFHVQTLTDRRVFSIRMCGSPPWRALEFLESRKGRDFEGCRVKSRKAGLTFEISTSPSFFISRTLCSTSRSG